jgi:hypothetical protein
MTAVFHRYFFPDDVHATVAYVAPVTSSRSDPRYVPYLEAIGPAACRDGLHGVQRRLLEARAALEELMAADAAASAESYDLLGLDRAFEFAVLELPFAFWQYGPPPGAGCDALPGPESPPAALFAFMEAVYGGVEGWVGDAALTFYAPYYYQSATELGGPAYPQAHLLDLLGGTPIEDVPEVYPPLGVEKPWDPAPMEEVDRWVRTEAERMLFVYGENDPWSAGAFTPAPGRDAYRYFAPGANHGARIASLAPADRDAALAKVLEWAGEPRPAAVARPGRAAAAAVPGEEPDAVPAARPKR